MHVHFEFVKYFGIRPGMGNSNMLGVNPFHVEVRLLGLNLILKRFHFPRWFQQGDACISARDSPFNVCWTLWRCFAWYFWSWLPIGSVNTDSGWVISTVFQSFQSLHDCVLTGFEKLLLPDILYEWLAIVAHLDEQVDDLRPGLGGQVVEVGKDPAHDETPNLNTR